QTCALPIYQEYLIFFLEEIIPASISSLKCFTAILLSPMNGLCLAAVPCTDRFLSLHCLRLSHLKTWVSGQVPLKLRKVTAIRVLIQACMKAEGKRQGSFMQEQENPVRGPGSSRG